ncbi:hypothetical protein CYLTODRAFT_15617 [Cylindrobasidium torrendii FP15055 ss-10]|uniref:DUF3752 domain-containing protein n=1 Tax=Cylindrobasidium torrendii FP15055 ss-10 TaxID=1314674 RepID=A0A0D7BAB4_9AGAR|nr:hypothetical protein CYLTODRAFT_15617 [Cylindrobasidium torrendii FP15055 ss-10]
MIGPELPPHLQQSAPQGDVSDDDDFGPAPPPAAPAPVAGPQLPAANEDEEEDDFGPALPPNITAAPKRVLGPSFPAPEDDSDDDLGPQPLPAYAQAAYKEVDGVKQFLEQEERKRKAIEEAAQPKALKRDEWMLRPPTSSELLANLDPSKMNKPRQFARSAAPATKNTDNTLWTETPAERQQRLADEVSGKKRRKQNADAEASPEEALEARKKRKRDESIRVGVDEHTVRGAALVAEHEKTLADTKDDESKAVWDHARDMSLGGRLMDDSQRKKMLRDAKGLGDRFGAGTSGGFL